MSCAKPAEAAGLSRQGTDALCRLGDSGRALAGGSCWPAERAGPERRHGGGAGGAAGRCVAALADSGADGTPAKLDLSLVNDMEYYNGLVLQGYLAGAPRAVLRGGRYDPLAARFRPGARAVGFALYLRRAGPAVRRGGGAGWPGDAERGAAQGPPGGSRFTSLLAGVGYGCPENYAGEPEAGGGEPRKAGIRYFLVKPSDVAIYVEHGAADVGIVGKDILAESGADVYELLDTGLGRCRMCVAGPTRLRGGPRAGHAAGGHQVREYRQGGTTPPRAGTSTSSS